jgi:hypothetical protein
MKKRQVNKPLKNIGSNSIIICIGQRAIYQVERCPSGRRSTIGNRVSAEKWIVGSNPTLSVSASFLVKGIDVSGMITEMDRKIAAIMIYLYYLDFISVIIERSSKRKEKHVL